MRDKDWVHHEGYPRDLEDDELALKQLATGDLERLVVVMELMSGHYDVAHHVAHFDGTFRGCSSSHPRCIGVIDRIDRRTRQVIIRLNDYGKKWMAKT